MNQTSHSHSHPQQEHNSSANAVGTTGSDKSARTLIMRWFLLSALLHGSTWSPCQQLHACSASVGIVICHQNHRNSKSLETASINSVSLKAQAPPNSGLSSHPTFPQSARATPLDLEATLQRHGAHLLGGSRVSRRYGQDEAQFVSCCCCFVWAMAIHESSVEFLDLGGLALKHLFLTWHKTCTPGTRCFSTRWWRQKRRNISGAKSKTICYTIEI